MWHLCISDDGRRFRWHFFGDPLRALCSAGIGPWRRQGSTPAIAPPDRPPAAAKYPVCRRCEQSYDVQAFLLARIDRSAK